MKYSKKGLFLVMAQVALCVALLWLGWRGVMEVPWLWIGVAIGGAILTSGVVTMRMGHVRVHPEPGEKAELCERGIYGHIRHPMYSGVLLAFAMFAVGAGWMGVFLWLGLLLVLQVKLRTEERLWSERDARYADYMKRTKRLVPGVW